MSRTKIGGNRIMDKSIRTRHLTDDFVIPEERVVLNYATHPHYNKDALDVIRNTNPELVKVLDLKDVMLAILEISGARLQGLTLENTIATKADKTIVDDIVKDLDEAKGGYTTLLDAFNGVISKSEEIILNHAGMVSHGELDRLYNEVRDARGIFDTLRERFESIGTGTGGGTGNVDVTMLTPWNFFVTLTEGQRVIELPNTYIVGERNLQVFEGPMLLYPGENSDYKETSPTTIELNYDVPAGTMLKIMGVGTGRLFDWVMYFSSVSDQTDIDFLDNYRPGLREIQVYEDGLLLHPESDYEEVSPTRIKMTTPLPTRSNIAIFKRRF